MEGPADMSAAITEVIVTGLTTRGDGTDDDPKRTVIQYFSKKGDLLWEMDPAEPKAELTNIQLQRLLFDKMVNTNEQKKKRKGPGKAANQRQDAAVIEAYATVWKLFFGTEPPSLEPQEGAAGEKTAP